MGRRLAHLRADLGLAEEQAAHYTDDADDARLRALVSETPLASAESREASRHSEAMARYRADLRTRIEELEAEQDTLLEALNATRRGR